MKRRTFLAAAAGAPLVAQTAPGFKIGVMDGVVQHRSSPDAIAVARSFGAEGLQVTLGRAEEGGRMPLEDETLQARYKAEAARQGLPIDATYIDILHVHCLKSDPAAPGLVRRGIEITRRLGAPILMTVFFGDCSIENRQELFYVADLFKELAAEAEQARVILGFENLLTAEDQARALDRVGSEFFKVYYDVGNSTNRVGADAPAEIRWLGADRICQFHFKDEGYLGEGKVNFPEVLRAIGDIGFNGYANLETRAPSGDFAADLRRNLAFLRRLL